MREAQTMDDVARGLDAALGAALQVLRTIQYGGRAEPDELRRVVDLGERVRNGAAWMSQGRIGSRIPSVERDLETIERSFRLGPGEALVLSGGTEPSGGRS